MYWSEIGVFVGVFVSEVNFFFEPIERSIRLSDLQFSEFWLPVICLQTNANTVGAVLKKEVIVQEPVAAVMRNKSVLCKPFCLTKATTCRPHSVAKACQTGQCPFSCFINYRASFPKKTQFLMAKNYSGKNHWRFIFLGRMLGVSSFEQPSLCHSFPSLTQCLKKCLPPFHEKNFATY